MSQLTKNSITLAQTGNSAPAANAQGEAAVTINLTEQATTAELTGYETTFGGYMSSIFNAVMVVSALLVLFYFMWGAVEWITSGGDQSKIQKGRDKITQSAIGIIVLSSTIVLFMIVQNFLGLNILSSQTPTIGPKTSKDTPYIYEVTPPSRTEFWDRVLNRKPNPDFEPTN